MELISAQEAANIVEHCLSARAQGELVEIMLDIKSACEEGFRQLKYDKSFHSQTLSELDRLGYKLEEHDSQIDGYSTTIKW